MGGLCKRFRFQYCIFEFWINEGMVVSLCVVIAFWLQRDEFEYAYIIRPLKYPRNISAVKAESESWWRAFCSRRQDATGTRPWCWWQPSLLPSHAWKPAIIKQWFELAVVRSAFQFSWQWWQQLIEYKLVLALSCWSRVLYYLWSNPDRRHP